jgi:thioredoxin:protein disulfide reductase
MRVIVAPSTDATWIPDPPLGQPRATSLNEANQSKESSGLQGSIGSMLFAFLGFGLLLSFTPCVFPMIPILSGMLVQSGERLTARRGFVLTGAYVFAMAFAYAALGVVVAWSGQNLQAALQTSIALGLMSAVFVALALSMFGLYGLQLPQAWQARIIGTGPRRSGCMFSGAFGVARALITYRSIPTCFSVPNFLLSVHVAQTLAIAKDDLTRARKSEHALAVELRKRS